MQPELRVVGAYSCEIGMEDAAIVNEINSHTPDMILLNLPVGVQESWIMEHSSLLNAKLCIAVRDWSRCNFSGLKFLAPYQIKLWR